jgi:hypothetical protein
MCGVLSWLNVRKGQCSILLKASAARWTQGGASEEVGLCASRRAHTCCETILAGHPVSRSPPSESGAAKKKLPGLPGTDVLQYGSKRDEVKNLRRAKHFIYQKVLSGENPLLKPFNNRHTFSTG